MNATVLPGKLKLKRPVPSTAKKSVAAQKSTASRSSEESNLAIDKVSSDECSPPTNSGERAIKATSQLSDTANASVKNQTSTKTAAQIAFEEVQKKRRQELAKRMASKSHREKVEEFNALLVKTPEHNDLFKIQYAGSG